MPLKRPRDTENTASDAMRFVNAYARRHGLPSEVGGSATEKKFLELAQAAREEYRLILDGIERDTSEAHPNQNSSLQHKHQHRLRANRNTGRAHKVFKEVFMLLVSTFLVQRQKRISAFPTSTAQGGEAGLAGENDKGNIAESWVLRSPRTQDTSAMGERNGFNPSKQAAVQLTEANDVLQLPGTCSRATALNESARRAPSSTELDTLPNEPQLPEFLNHLSSQKLPDPSFDPTIQCQQITDSLGQEVPTEFHLFPSFDLSDEHFLDSILKADNLPIVSPLIGMSGAADPFMQSSSLLVPNHESGGMHVSNLDEEAVVELMPSEEMLYHLDGDTVNAVKNDVSVDL